MEQKLYIPFLDLTKVNAEYAGDFLNSFSELLTKGVFIKGEAVDSFEREFANFCGVSHCIGTGNGLDALKLILQGYIELGRLQKGDEVLIAANTFVATVLAVIQADLVPVFVEPDPITFNLDPNQITNHISEKTKVVLPTHLYGQLADMDGIKSVAKEYGLLVISDAAQAHGAMDLNGKCVGNICDASAFSFYPAKNLGALGDGGAVVTNDLELSKIIKSLGNYGTVEKYNNQHIGVNSRLDEIQAAFLLKKLTKLAESNDRRKEIASKYLRNIKNDKIKLPYWDGSNNHVFHLFVIRVVDRNDFCEYLKEHGIGFGIHYPIPPHKQKALEEFSYLSLPITEEIHRTVVSIPLNEVLTESEVNRIIQILNNY